MKDRSLALRYARALLSTLNPETAERADTFLFALKDAMQNASDFRDLLLDPAIPKDSRKLALVNVAEQQGMPSEVTNFLKTIVDNNRAAVLPSIAEVFREEREEAAGIVPAEITTAVPLGPELEARARQALEKATGKRIRLTQKTDRSLIGGAITRVGSKVYDGSLRTQLNQLRQKMME